MPLIPEHLQTLKREAEVALGLVTLHHPSLVQAISKYWGALELELEINLPKPKYVDYPRENE